MSSTFHFFLVLLVRPLLRFLVQFCTVLTYSLHVPMSQCSFLSSSSWLLIPSFFHSDWGMNRKITSHEEKSRTIIPDCDSFKFFLLVYPRQYLHPFSTSALSSLQLSVVRCSFWWPLGMIYRAPITQRVHVLLWSWQKIVFSLHYFFFFHLIRRPWRVYIPLN